MSLVGKSGVIYKLLFTDKSVVEQIELYDSLSTCVVSQRYSNDYRQAIEQHFSHCSRLCVTHLITLAWP